jgi:hypothetical protein
MWALYPLACILSQECAVSFLSSWTRPDKIYRDSETHARWLSVMSENGRGPITATVYGLTCQYQPFDP